MTSNQNNIHIVFLCLLFFIIGVMFGTGQAYVFLNYNQLSKQFGLTQQTKLIRPIPVTPTATPSATPTPTDTPTPTATPIPVYIPPVRHKVFIPTPTPTPDPYYNSGSGY